MVRSHFQVAGGLRGAQDWPLAPGQPSRDPRSARHEPHSRTCGWAAAEFLACTCVYNVFSIVGVVACPGQLANFRMAKIFLRPELPKARQGMASIRAAHLAREFWVAIQRGWQLKGDGWLGWSRRAPSWSHDLGGGEIVEPSHPTGASACRLIRRHLKRGRRRVAADKVTDGWAFWRALGYHGGSGRG
jgi:hypothetical protein